MSEPWLSTHIERWPTAKLVPYARNARTHSDEQVAQIAASIVEFGFTNPILAGSDGVIVAGHGRLAAAQKLGLDTVPVVVLDHLTPTQRRALIIADNRIAENAGWDDAMLRIELQSLQEDGFNLDITGFDADAHKTRSTRASYIFKVRRFTAYDGAQARIEVLEDRIKRLHRMVSIMANSYEDQEAAEVLASMPADPTAL